LPNVVDAGICRKGECIPNVQCVEECSAALAPEASRRVAKKKAQCASLAGTTETDACMRQIGALESPETDWVVESLLQCFSRCGFIADEYRELFRPKPLDSRRTKEGGAPDGH
jgi:hypothetical protein